MAEASPRRRQAALAACALLFIGLTAFPAARAQQPAAPAATDSETPQAAAARGAALFEERRFGEALEALESALAGGQRDGRTLFMAAQSQQETRKSRADVLRTVTEALPALQQAVQKSDAGLIDHSFLSRAYALAGDEVAARKAAAAGVAAFRGGAWGGMDAQKPADLFRLADMAILAADWKLAEDSLERVIAASGGGEDDNLAARALSSLGRARLAAGQPQQAAEAYRRALDLRPDEPGARIAYARALFRAGDYKAAAGQWRELRIMDASLSSEATYAIMVLGTLSQEKLLRDPERPLDDLTALSRTDLEERMLAEAEQMGQAAATLPEEISKRGYAGRDADDSTRAAVARLRDSKLRLAWSAAEYVDRGYPIREFAFSRGLQGLLRDWRLPKGKESREPEPMPMEWLNDAQREEYQAREAKRKLRKAGREDDGGI